MPKLLEEKGTNHDGGDKKDIHLTIQCHMKTKQSRMLDLKKYIF